MIYRRLLIYLFFTFISIYHITGCSDSTSDLQMPDNSRDFDLMNRMVLFSGNENENDSRYNIGILIDGVSDQEAREIVDRAFGEGKFSLFKTYPFSDNKDKFNVYYGTISIDDKNEIYAIPESDLTRIRQETAELFGSTEINSPSDLSGVLEPLATYLGLDFTEESPTISDDILNSLSPLLRQVIDQDINTLPEYYYANITSIFNNTGSARFKEGELSMRIQRNLQAFRSVFANYDFLHSKGFVSKGIIQGYANTKSKDFFLPLYEENLFLNTLDPASFHEDNYTVTAVHEFGHIFANLKDEYSAYDATDISSMPIADLNCFDEGAENPWNSIIPGYTADTVFGGCDRGASYRGTENSIMRTYFRYNATDWKTAWGVINEYYIRQVFNDPDFPSEPADPDADL